jgi:hypothetical protein
VKRSAARRSRTGVSTAACLLALVLAACAGPTAGLRTDDARLSATIARLQGSLSALGPGVDRAEAGRVARTAVTVSLQLADDYRVTPPARWHNLMIQMGFRDRGLCYHWTEDLMRHLMALDPATLELHWGVAHKGSHLREHNSVVVTARGEPFRCGLVLDPWRNSGDLYWVAVDRDSYPWEPLPRGEW